MLSPEIATPDSSLSLAASKFRLPLRVNVVKITFWLVFALAFCLSGVLTLATNQLYRLGLTSLLVLPLVLLYGFRVNWVFIGYVLLTLTVFASAVVNHSPILDIIEFSRILIFSYLIYYLVTRYMRPTRVRKVFGACIFIGWLQLPVILVQRFFYHEFPASVRAVSTVTDIGFGTFNFKTDYALTFFLCLLVALLLFENKRLQIVKNSWPHVLWFSLTIFVANAQVMKIYLLLIWTAFFLFRFNLRTILYCVATVALGIGLLWGVDTTGLITENSTEFVNRIRQMATTHELNNTDSYLRGNNYSRSAAFVYLLTEGRSLLGDGPAKYQNAVTREMTRANHGHFFAFVSEIGWLGWSLSCLTFFLIAFPVHGSFIKFSVTRVLAFIGMNALSLTSNVMNDVAVMLIFCIISQYHLFSVAIPTQLSPATSVTSAEVHK